MEPEIKTLLETKLVGMRLKMSLAANRTQELWQGFMPRRGEILKTLGPELYSVGVYGPAYFQTFSPANEFEKWATVAVSDFDAVPAGMETLTLPGGLYAVFAYKGASSAAPQVFQYIFGTWLPRSGYLVDGRPHVEIMGEKYRNDHPDSEEDICIPIRPR